MNVEEYKDLIYSIWPKARIIDIRKPEESGRYLVHFAPNGSFDEANFKKLGWTSRHINRINEVKLYTNLISDNE